MDVEEENIQLLKSVKQEGTAWPSHTSALEAAHSSSPPIDIKPIIKGDALLSPSVTRCDAFCGTSLLSSASSHLLVTCHLSHTTCLKQVPSHMSRSKDINLAQQALTKGPTLKQALFYVFTVECPVCSVSVPQHFINKHLDTCLTRGEKKESLRR